MKAEDINIDICKQNAETFLYFINKIQEFCKENPREKLCEPNVLLDLVYSQEQDKFNFKLFSKTTDENILVGQQLYLVFKQNPTDELEEGLQMQWFEKAPTEFLYLYKDISFAVLLDISTLGFKEFKIETKKNDIFCLFHNRDSTLLSGVYKTQLIRLSYEDNVIQTWLLQPRKDSSDAAYNCEL